MRLSRLLRNRLLGTTRRLVEPVARWRAERAPPVVALATVQRRLEMLLGAMFGETVRVVPPGSPTTSDGHAVVLPASIGGAEDGLERYRLLAIEQGARIMRGTRAAAPADPLERDLYMVLEGAAIDTEIVRRAPGLAGALGRLRAEELARRPGMQRFVPQQREVELRLRALLASEPGADVAAVPRMASAAESANAAREMAAQMRRATITRVQYRQIPSVRLWERDSDPGVWRPDDNPMFGEFKSESSSRVESPDGKDGRSDRDETAEREDAVRGSVTADTSAGRAMDDHGKTNDPFSPSAGSGEDPSSDESEGSGRTGGIHYPEWIARHGRLEPRHTTVHPVAAAERDDAWARAALHEHRPLVRQVRDRFALLRARRARLHAQRAGDELDLDACVGALIDVRLGRVPTDRLYQETRATRHSLAILILVDVSGSTKTALPDGRTVLDVERLSLLLASEALEALGDPYSILTFSGLGRHDVRVATVKGFAEHDQGAVHRRISSLEPEDNTRLGAAVRHATAVLRAQPAGRKVLLLLSDGRPNDVDRYQGSDAIEDSRQALADARAKGVHNFCLTVDAEEAEYLPHLFGVGGYRVLRDAAQLPGALIRLVDRLLRG
jgi:nitric oxide reductase NorD protein